MNMRLRLRVIDDVQACASGRAYLMVGWPRDDVMVSRAAVLEWGNDVPNPVWFPVEIVDEHGKIVG